MKIKTTETEINKVKKKKKKKMLVIEEVSF